MIARLMQNIPYVLKVLPTKVKKESCMEEIWNCLNALHKNWFCISGIVCNKHPSNVSAYHKFLAHCKQKDTKFFISLKNRKYVYFFQKYYPQFAK